MTTSRPPFRFAVQAVRAKSAREWRDLATKTQDLGYSTLFLADHVLGPGPAMQAAQQFPQHVAPIAAMATAAAVTDTLRVGCRVFCIDYHVPAVLVKEAATLDLLSEGRLEFGIGAGWSEHEYEAVGLSFGAAPDRVEKLKEVVELFVAQCRGEQLDQRGRFVHASGYAGLPLPAQRPHPPIMVGGGRKKVLSYAAQHADIVSINNVPFDPVDEAGRTPQQEAERRLGFVRDAAGDRFATLEVESSPFFTQITDDAAGAAVAIASTVGCPAEGLVDHPNVLLGGVDALADVLVERRERYGVNYVTVQQRELEAFAPVVARLAGR
jgi:probable F420-dependent oxidoreductase